MSSVTSGMTAKTLKTDRPGSNKERVIVNKTASAKKTLPSKCTKPTTAKTPVSKVKIIPKPARKVEILDPKLMESGLKSEVVIDSSTCNIHYEERIKKAAGIRPSVNKNQLPITKTIPTISSDKTLGEPKFQSSLSLMKNLELLKNLHVDASSLLQLKLEKDNKVQTAINQEVCIESG